NKSPHYLPDQFCRSPSRDYFCRGEMAERSNAAVLKTVDPKGPGVRIPLSPPSVAEALAKATSAFSINSVFIAATFGGRSPQEISLLLCCFNLFLCLAICNIYTKGF